MGRRGRSRKTWVLGLVGLSALALAIAVVALDVLASPIGRFVRGVALLAYLAMFLATLSSAFTRELVRFFGRPFLRVHHVLSVTGLALIVLHPLAYALQVGSLAVFVPVFGSPIAFLRWGGRLALYLFLVAAAAAALRKAVGRNWRLVHLLTYAAFMLVTIHAGLIGTDFRSAAARAAAASMAAVVTGVLVWRRVRTRGR